MLPAVFIRTLKPGVTYEQFKEAWVPEGADGCPARASVGRNVADDRQVITILELEMSLAEFQMARARLARPDALERLAEIVESTELEAVYQEVFDSTALRPGPAGAAGL